MQKSFGPKNLNSQQTADYVHHNNDDMNKREAELAKREGVLEERERQITEKNRSLDEKIERAEKVRKDLLDKLESVAKMSLDDAKKILLDQTEKDLAVEISKKIKEAEEEMKHTIDERAREVLADAMMHGFVDIISEYTTSRVDLPSEEVKGRIIGKEGRNIRTFEQVTGVDVVMDDEIPNSLVLSSFDSVRREIARVSLLRLIEDGRIQPQRIEEIVEKTEQDIEKIMLTAGENLCHDAGVYNLPVDLVKLLGRFKYRFSFGQNLIQHSLEVSKIAAALAKEIGADVNMAKIGGLLHDIGKVIIEGDEGTHVDKGVVVAKQFGMPDKVVNAIAEHHEDKPFSSVESILVCIADAISGGRAGARHENVGDYINRMEDIEKIASSYDSVDRAFAVQAGREVRVIVMPERISDDELPKLVHDIAQRISKEVMVPGAVKITAIRETRATETTMTTNG